jgi:hypothetical protein
MTSSDDKPLEALLAKLNEADTIVEQTLKAHATDDPAYDTLKHVAFAELNEVLIEIKSALNVLDPDLNLRPINRMLEEFRDVHAGSINVLMMHESPDLKNVTGLKLRFRGNGIHSLRTKQSSAGRGISLISTFSYIGPQGKCTGTIY